MRSRAAGGARALPSPPWTTSDIRDLRGHTAVVTGANTGLGFETARTLAAHGAAVVLACRDISRAADARARLRTVVPDADIEVVQVDLASMASVREAAEELRGRFEKIDLLIHNAGTANTRLTLTEDGFESTLATNHLGPFALTGLLMDRLTAAPSARIVTVSSSSHMYGAIDVDDLHLARRPYRTHRAYSQSKLANLMFTSALQRQLTEAGARVLAVAAHPGVAETDFNRNMGPVTRALASPRLRPLLSWARQSPAMGALPTVRAAVDPDVRGGEFYGPSAPHGMTGHPVRVRRSARSRDHEVQDRLWRESERLTGIRYSFGPAAR